MTPLLSRISLISLATKGLMLLLIVYGNGCKNLTSYSNQTLKGRILSREKKPLSEVLVAVESGNFDGPYNPKPVFVKTNEDGLFEVNPKSDSYSIRAWKEGYAESGCNSENCISDGSITIELRKIESGQPLPTIKGFYNLGGNVAFSFRRGEVTNKNDPEADFIINTDPTSPSQIIISVPHPGGISSAPISLNLDFDNVALAPEIYENSVQTTLGSPSIFFVKTPNGKYAKFRIMPDFVLDPTGQKRMDFTNCRLIWAFQSDDSRNLETASAVNPPALFEEMQR
ncbi:MAG: hypothetical protein IPI76_16630 [Chloracidobacterium sp.]|nr:hypothetical protein [Chloracidobacterium sp.]MBK9768449.1 hypothetical protein [Chloracidobacterium sp.]MBL0242433.1 hypothetical protein [Chloracidobacterium sp.]